jgi:hypothetical protein
MEKWKSLKIWQQKNIQPADNLSMCFKPWDVLRVFNAKFLGVPAREVFLVWEILYSANGHIFKRLLFRLPGNCFALIWL